MFFVRAGSVAGTLLWLLLAAVAQAQAPYIHPTYRFGFTPPAGWVQKAHPDAAAVFMEPRRAPARTLPQNRIETHREFVERVNRSLKTPAEAAAAFTANITVVTRPLGNMTLEEYARHTRAEAARSRSYRILKESRRRLGGLPAVERVVRLSIPGDPPAQIRELTCIRDGQLFVLTLAAEPATFARYSTEFDKVIASFTWR
jgi:hypothetical protein